MNDEYPLLEQLMGGYLNIDCSIITHSDSVEGAIDYYIAEIPDEYLRQLVKEMEQFELEHANDLDAQFDLAFHVGVTLDSVHDFFELVKSKIQKHLEPST